MESKKLEKPRENGTFSTVRGVMKPDEEGRRVFPTKEKEERKMSVLTLNKENFEELVIKAEGTVAVDFWAAWCGPCRMFTPIVEEFAAQHPEIRVGKVNVDENPELADRYRIMSIPAFLVFRNGQLVQSSVGVKSKNALEELVK